MSTHRKLIAPFVLFSGLFGNAAFAQDAKIFAGAECVRSNSTSAANYNYYAIRNTGTSSQTVLCPIVRDDTTGSLAAASVWVKDVTSSGSVSCTLWSCDPSGTSCGTSGTLSSSGSSSTAQELVLTGLPSGVSYGSYVLYCSLPAKTSSTTAPYSEIDTYIIEE